MSVCSRVYRVCVHECWCPRETGGLGSFGAGVTGGCGMSQPPVIYLFIFDMHKMSALPHNENMIGYVCCLSLVFDFLQMDTQYPYSIACISVTFPFLEYYYKDTLPTVCLTLPSNLLKGEQCPHQPHTLLRQCLPVSYTPLFVAVVL